MINQKTTKPILTSAVLSGLSLLSISLTYQAFYKLITLLNWTIPDVLLVLFSLFVGSFISLCIYDFLAGTDDLIQLRDALKQGLQEINNTIKRYLLFLQHRKLIKPHLHKIVQEYKETPNLLKEGWKYHCFEEVLLEHGVLMYPETDVNKHSANSDELCYVEGYTIFSEPNSRLFILSHAWMATTKPKKALDVLNNSPGTCYFGVPFSRQWISQLLQQRKQRGDKESLVFDIRTIEGLEILKYGLPEEALADIR